MYSKDGVIQDRREMLRVKAKSLAEEARIIRHEELKLHRNNDGLLREELHRHRTMDVRAEARATYLAYGLIKGKPLDRIERPATPRTDFLWKKVRAMVDKYGPIAKEAKTSMLALCQG